MRHVSESESYPTGPNPAAGFPSGSREVDAFCADLGLTSQLDPNRIEALATDLAAAASAAAPPNQHGVELGRRRRPLLGRWRRRAALTTLMSSIVAKVAFATVAVATTTGGLAATGNLPDQAQRVVSDLAARVGVHIPEPVSSGVDWEIDEVTTTETETADAGTEVTVGEATPAIQSITSEDDPTISQLDDAPTLPESASETARAVRDIILGSEGSEGSEGDHPSAAGKRIAEVASGGRSDGAAKSTARPDHAGPPDDRPSGASNVSPSEGDTDTLESQ